MNPIAEKPPAAGHRWYHKASALLYAVFCFELGIFLLVFPWLDSWSSNSVRSFIPWLQSVWILPEFRGAVSGLGVVNLYIALGEIFRLRRFSGE